MFVLGLLICIVLRAFDAQAKVVNNFNECSEFLYKGKEPTKMDQNAMKICQRLENTQTVYYATLYSVHHKIPLYSAYTLGPSCPSDTTTGKTNKWHIEPKISDSNSPIDYMIPENKDSQNTYKKNQAVSSDYSETGYDRGHLNPNSFSCTDEGRTATFTLTNAAPMDACFNRIQWKQWESTLKSFLTKKLDSDRSATAYIVTGTVPDATLKIPKDSKRVTVPSHIWTAVCYKHNTADKSFSFGYIGENLPGGRITLMSVSKLNNQLSNTQTSMEIFEDNCFEDDDKLNEVKKAFQKLINLPVNKGVQVTTDVQDMYRALQTVSTDSLSAGENVMVTEISVKLTFSNPRVYSRVVEDLKVFAESDCPITNYGQESVECQLALKKRKVAADGSSCSSITTSGSDCQCNTGGETKHCCSTPCVYKRFKISNTCQDQFKGYTCYSGQTEIACSPQYSLITAKGKRCKDDHPCGTYGYDYYWCNTIPDSWDYCSPPLWRSKAKNGKYCRSNHACAKYGKSQQWCYTDDKGNFDQCCFSDDSFSAVNGKTCRSNHLCGYHGKGYLWCYTTDGSWDKCCTSCNESI